MFEPSAARWVRYVAVPTLWAVFTVAGCSRGQPSVPDVLGIQFGITVNDIKHYLPDGAKPERYPIILLYGYKLVYPNPENWAVFVQEDGPDDLRASAIWLIAISRKVGDSCTGDDTEKLVAALAKKYQPQFDASYTQKVDELHGFELLGVSQRRMLQVRVYCFLSELCASFTYMDLDRYQYRNPAKVEQLLSDALRQAGEYGSRSFR